MAYMTLQSGYCTGSNPGSVQANNGGLRMYWELRFYTSAESPTIMHKSYSCPAGSYRLYYKLQAWYGINISANVRIGNRIGTTNAAFVRFRSGNTDLWSMGTTNYDYPSRNPSFGDNSPPNTWYSVEDATYSDSYRVYPEGLIAVSQGTTLSLNLTYNVGIWYSSADNRHTNANATSGSTSVTVTGGQSAIASLTASVQTLDTVQLEVTRYNAAYWHKAAFSVGGTTLYTSDTFETSLSFTAPRSWFANYPDSGSLAVSVSLQTYTDASCTEAVGTPATAAMTVTPDAGMAPVLDASFATVSADNTGTAAASIIGFVQGYSKAKLRLKLSGVTTSLSAAIISYDVICQGETQTVNDPGATEDVLTVTLTGTAAITITVTASDSRGLSASMTLSVTPMPYAVPTLSGIDVFRCLSDGTESEDGNYVSVKATGNVSSLNSQNTLALTVQLAVGSGAYGAAQSLASGVASILGGALDPDQRLRVLITAADALGNETTALRSFPTRIWAMKFRATGDGVAFGKAPEHGAKKLELPADWDILFGAASFLNRVYPVGSIYMSVNSTDPGTLFGGTWEQLEDVFLLAAGDTYAAGSTGGEAAHTLSEAELPAITGSASFRADANPGSFRPTGVFSDAGTGVTSGQLATSGTGAEKKLGLSFGGGQAHNNMPPYLAVYVWKRTA